jgi:DNA polymerase-3 subunit delta
MAQKKAHEVDTWLARPDEKVRVVLIYGPDRGLVSERARAFASKTGLSLDDPFSVVRLDAGAVEQDPGKLIDEARMVAMFASQRLIWVRNAGAQKGLADAVKLLVAEPPEDAVILIEAGDLKKGTSLRSAVETGTPSIALPCYGDDGRGIDRLIDDELGKAGLSITLEARQALKSTLGGDRLASRGEIEKLVLYCHGRGRIDVEDAKASTGDVSALSVDDAVDAVLDGDPAGLDNAFTRMASTGTAPAVLLGAVMRQFNALQLMRDALDNGGASASSVVAAARPPVFFSRRKTIERALVAWSEQASVRALQRLRSAILQTRRKPEIAVPAARQALLALAIESARNHRSRR